MRSLAIAILLDEWRRFLPAVLAIAFAGLLVLVQAGLLFGTFSSVSVYIDRSSADLWVGYPGTPSVDLPLPVPEKYESNLRMNPAVADVERFTWTLGSWRRPSGEKLSVVLVGVDSRANALSFGRLLTPRVKQLLLTPDNVLVDEADLSTLGVRVGDDAELNGKRVHIAGTVNGIRSTAIANVISSLYTARRVDSSLISNEVDYFLVKLRDPAQARRIRDQLQPVGYFVPYQVWTATEFSRQSVLFWLSQAGVGSSFLFSSLLGVVIGVVITAQTLKTSVMANLHEYAILQALGVSRRALRSVVLAQCCWVGIAGVVLTIVPGALIMFASLLLSIAFVIPWLVALGVFLLMMLITLSGGLNALRVLHRAEPFALLR